MIDHISWFLGGSIKIIFSVCNEEAVEDFFTWNFLTTSIGSSMGTLIIFLRLFFLGIQLIGVC